MCGKCALYDNEVSVGRTQDPGVLEVQLLRSRVPSHPQDVKLGEIGVASGLHWRRDMRHSRVLWILSQVNVVSP
jgi:hypothetical protein